MGFAYAMVSWLICLPAAAVFSYWWGMSAFGGSLLGARAFAILALPVILGASLAILRRMKLAVWVAYFVAVAPWIAFPVVALLTFVPRGENDEWVGLFFLMLKISAVAPIAPVIYRSLTSKD